VSGAFPASQNLTHSNLLSEDVEYIVRLVGQVLRVNVETVRIVGGLPECYTG